MPELKKKSETSKMLAIPYGSHPYEMFLCTVEKSKGLRGFLPAKKKRDLVPTGSSKCPARTEKKIGNRPLHLQDRKAVHIHETKPVYPEGGARAPVSLLLNREK